MRSLQVFLRAAQAYLPFLHQQPVLAPSTAQQLSIVLIPNFDLSLTKVESLTVGIGLPQITVHANTTLVELPLWVGNTPTQQYDESRNHSLQAFDDAGPLRLTIMDDHSYNMRRWLPQRDTHGQIIIFCTAFPGTVEIHTSTGPRTDLRQIDGGLLGSGVDMIPVPPFPDEEYNILFKWAHKDFPPGISWVTTFPYLTESYQTLTDARVEVLQRSLFAVGTKLNRYPPHLPGTVPGTGSKNFGLYWFGDEKHVPFNVSSLGAYIQELHGGMDMFFQNPYPGNNDYSIFLRQSMRGFGAASFNNAFILEYHHSENVTLSELRRLVAHEMVHKWALMELPARSNSISASNVETTWYNEGIASYYATFFPYRLNATDRREFLKSLNFSMQAYYTNPAIKLTNRECAQQQWQNIDAHRLPHHRGMAYFLLLGWELRQQFNDTTTIDDLVIQLLNKRRSEQRHDRDVWLELVSAKLGMDKAREMYEAMANGTILTLPPDTLGNLNLTLVPQEQERLELGFATRSFETRVVEGVVAGSRAEAAGIRDGDYIINSTMYWQVADEIGRNMCLRLRRDVAEEWDVEYWARSFGKVKSYQWRDDGVN